MINSKNFSDYMITQSVNRSFNHSPTSGIVHRTRNSYGPRLTLVNRSRDQSMKDELKNQSTQYLQKILLLSIEITRLKQENSSMKRSIKVEENQNNKRSQAFLLKQTNQSLKIGIKTLQKQLIKSKEEKTKIETSYQAKLSQNQIQLKNLSWKVNDLEKQLQMIKKVKAMYESQSEQARFEMQKSKIMSKVGINNVYKSITEEKNGEIADLKQKVSKYQYLLKDQKNIIQSQNEELRHLREIQQKLTTQYQSNLQVIRSRINYELIEAGINTSVNYENKELVQELELDLAELLNEIKLKQSTIDELTQNNAHLREKCINLESRFCDYEFNCHKKLTKIEESYKFTLQQKQKLIAQLNDSKQSLQLEKNQLQITIEQLKYFTAANNKELMKKYNTALLELKKQPKVTSKLKSAKMDKKLVKSKSIELTSFFYDESSKHFPKLNIDSIIVAAQQLQKTTERSSRLISKSRSKLKGQKSKTNEHQNWLSSKTIKLNREQVNQYQSDNEKKMNQNHVKKRETPVDVYYKN